MGINNRNGRIEGIAKVSDLEEYLKGHKEMYGNTDVVFMCEGDKNVTVQFDHFKNALTIDVAVKDDDEDDE